MLSNKQEALLYSGATFDFHFIRHGAVDAERKLYGGASDLPLMPWTTKSKQRIETLAARLPREPQTIWTSSDLSRAADTLEALRDAWLGRDGFDPENNENLEASTTFHKDEQFREIELGSLDGMLYPRALRELGAKNWTELYNNLYFTKDKRWKEFGAEQPWELSNRVSSGLMRIVDSADPLGAPDNGPIRVVVVAHRGSIQAAVLLLFGEKDMQSVMGDFRCEFLSHLHVRVSGRPMRGGRAQIMMLDNGDPDYA